MHYAMARDCAAPSCSPPRSNCGAAVSARRVEHGGNQMGLGVAARTARVCRRPAFAAVVIAWSLACGLAQAAYPERLITLIVPFPAGGPTDIIARIVSVGLPRSLGQSVIVDNGGGGGGNSRYGNCGPRGARRLYAAAHLDRYCGQPRAL